MAESLPVDWNVMPGVFDLHVASRYDGRHEIVEGHCGEEAEHNEPEV